MENVQHVVKIVVVVLSQQIALQQLQLVLHVWEQLSFTMAYAIHLARQEQHRI